MSLWKKIAEGLKSPSVRDQEEALKRAIEQNAKDLAEAEAKVEAARLEAEKVFAKKKAAAEKRKQTLAEKKKQPKSAKEIATKKGEAYISVLSVSIDKNNISNGSFELDWNDIFIKELRTLGYPGKTDEDVVDIWFQNVCRNVIAETYEQEAAQKMPPDNVRYINRTPKDDGRTEVS